MNRAEIIFFSPAVHSGPSQGPGCCSANAEREMHFIVGAESSINS